eukprot:364586-Chlamydomonas_euryale.AAC.1
MLAPRACWQQHPTPVCTLPQGKYDALPEGRYSGDLRRLVASMLTRDVHARPTVNELLTDPAVVARVQ